MTTTHGADRPNEAEPVMARIGEAIALGQQRHRPAARQAFSEIWAGGLPHSWPTTLTAP